MKHFFMVLMLPGLCGLIFEFADPNLRLSRSHWFNVLLCLSWFLFFAFLSILLGEVESRAKGPKPRKIETEQGYMIHDVITHYPYIVGADQLQEMMIAGGFVYDGPATEKEAGNHYYNNNWIPAGHIEKGRKNIKAGSR